MEITLVEHCVLRCADIHERSFHTGQYVLDLGQIDVAVDLTDVVGWTGQVVLDELSSLQHGDLGHAAVNADAHEVAADGLTPSLSASSSFEGVLV